MRKSVKVIVASVLTVAAVITATVTSLASGTGINCSHSAANEIGREWKGANFASLDLHIVEYEVEYFCPDCVEFYFRTEYEYESHNYVLDYDTNQFICTECEDAYGATR